MARVEQEFRTLISEPEPGVRSIATRIMRPDGTGRLVDSVARRLPTGLIVSNVRDITDRWRMEACLRAIVEGTAAATGDHFFRSLVEHLARGLGVRHAFVAEVTDEAPDRVRTIAFWSSGAIVPNVEYPLTGTPCEKVIAGSLCRYRRSCRDREPDGRVTYMNRAGRRLLGLSEQEALRIAEEDPPFDIAILDMHMPGMDGMELARALCARHRPAQLPRRLPRSAP